MKTKTNWLAMLAVVAALTSAQTVRAITFGEPDENLHPNVGAIMITWPDDLYDGLRFAYSSGTLVYKGQDSQGKWTGVLLTAGHSTDEIQAGIDSGEITSDQVTVNFSADANSPEHDIRVVGIQTILIARPGYNNWDDVGILILQVDDPSDLPEPAVLAPVGFLDQFSQQELQDTQLTGVGYGCSLMFPPPETYYANQRQICTPKYLNLFERTVLLQVNGPAGNSGVAWGDSGGPLFWKEPGSGSEIIVAIGSSANTPTFTSIARHYRVDTALVHDFIRLVIDEL
jgi:hypothetical protein